MARTIYCIFSSLLYFQILQAYWTSMIFWRIFYSNTIRLWCSILDETTTTIKTTIWVTETTTICTGLQEIQYISRHGKWSLLRQKCKCLNRERSLCNALTFIDPYKKVVYQLLPLSGLIAAENLVLFFLVSQTIALSCWALNKGLLLSNASTWNLQRAFILIETYKRRSLNNESILFGIYQGRILNNQSTLIKTYNGRTLNNEITFTETLNNESTLIAT